MNLSEFSIRNPVFAVMLSAAMIVFGYLGYREMGVSQFPEIDFPVISVIVTREAASPDVMDGDVTNVIEDAVAGVEGVDYISSQSLEGTSIVTVFFRLSRSIDAAMQDVQNAVSASRRQLPVDVDPPVISKVNPNNLPVMWLCLYGSKPLNQISDYAENYFKQQLETIPGVGGVLFGGLRSRNIRVWIDTGRLAGYELAADDVIQTLKRQHTELPAGYIESNQVEFNVRTMGEAYSMEDFKKLLLAERDGQQVHLQDVAVIEDGLQDRRSLARYNRLPCVAIGVRKAIGGNLVAVCEGVKARLPILEKALPEGMQLSVPVDYSVFVHKDVDEVKLTLFLGILLTAAVCFVFLGSFGSTLNIFLSIPTSLIGTFFVMRYLGFTINLMTLLALSLSVGVVVDDAILVLENIYRHREMGVERRQAALIGSREIAFAAIAATVSIMAIFLPVAFMTGTIGKFFFQFGVTVSVAVFLSLVSALTLTPLFCSQFLNAGHGRSIVHRYFLGPLLLWPVDWAMHFCTWIYAKLLWLSLRLRWLVVVAGGGLIAVSWWLIHFEKIGTELVPSEDQSRFQVQVVCPVGSSIDYVDEVLQQCEAYLVSRPDVAGLLTTVATEQGQLISQADLFVRLVPHEERTRKQSEIMNEVRDELSKIPGLRIVVLDLSTQGFTAQEGFPIDFAVQGPDWDKVTQYSQQIMAAMAASGAVQDVDSDYRPGMPELHILPDREMCAMVGVPVGTLADTISALVGGIRVAKYTDHGKRYDVRVRLQSDQRSSPTNLPRLSVRAAGGKLVQLRDVAQIEIVPTLPIINRYNHQRKVEITANAAHGVSQGEAIRKCQEIAASVLPQGYTFVDLGNAQAMSDTLSRLIFALALGVLIAYMILGVQFNSFIHPLTVLMAMPFAVTGALATLWWTGDTINMMSMIGLILLMGLVKKNSIILVDYTNQLRAAGMQLEEAVLAACPVRLRPIIMTSVATIAGAVPAAIGLGPGAETRAPMARSIIGGIVLSTLVTLIMVPVFYVMFENARRMIASLAFRSEAKPVATLTSPGALAPPAPPVSAPTA